MIAAGKIGNVKSVHFEWLLVSQLHRALIGSADEKDTVHGADYFRRWHRYKDRSGGELARALVAKLTFRIDGTQVIAPRQLPSALAGSS